MTRTTGLIIAGAVLALIVAVSFFKGFRASTQYMAGQTIGYAGTGNLTVDNDPDVQ